MPAMTPLWLLLAVVGGAVARDSQPPQIVRDKARTVILKTGGINRFLLECVAIAEPAPTYHWFRDGEELVDEVEGVVRQDRADQSQLDFSSPRPEHAGNYHCEAANTLGRARSSLARVVTSLPDPPAGTVAPTFTHAPLTEVQTLGSRVELRCEAEGSPQPEIVWLKNGEEVMRGEARLVIASLHQNSVANYACNASNVAGYDYKNVIVNILTVAAKIKEGPRELLVASKGRDVVLPCRAEGYPVPTIVWTRDGAEVEEGEGDKYRMDSGFLTILKAGSEDQGSYTCTASNQGTDTMTGRLVVQDKTEIITGPRDRTELVQTEVLELECEVVADLSDGQVLSVSWKKDGVDLCSEAGCLSDRVEVAANHSLFLRDLAFSDSGTYTCVGGTGIRDLDTVSGFLTVVGVPPSLGLGQVETERWEGEKLEVRCTLEQGYTKEGPPKIYWYKDGERVGKEGDYTMGRILEDGQLLVIDRATAQHSGLWVCSAENSEGKDVQQVELMVRRRTELARQPQDLVYTQGQAARFQCVAVADQSLQKKLSVSWRHDGEEVIVDCAFLCQDGVTCLQAEQLCDGEENCPGGEEEQLETCGVGADMYDYDESAAPPAHEEGPCALDSGSKFVLADHTLVLCSPTEQDLGSYTCHVASPLEQPIASQVASLYLHTVFPWWIIFLIFAILVLLISVCLFLSCWKRRRSGTKGFYNPMDPESMKHNQSDIYYTTEDADSIMQEVDTSCSDLLESASKAPIFTPKTMRHLQNNSGVGSCGSLLEDDEFLKKGMNEDGSFRERYAE